MTNEVCILKIGNMEMESGCFLNLDTFLEEI